MQRYFDAFLYLANWGTHRIALRLPVGVLDPGTAAEYCVGESACSWATRTHVIVDLHSEDEDGDEEYDGVGHLAAILPARAELAAGDRRLLYLAWLLGRKYPAIVKLWSDPCAEFVPFLAFDVEIQGKVRVALRAARNGWQRTGNAP
ncbi:transposase [Micromonospora sp. DR5-3]|uniref:transposase n=1 Tax=Micromonospora sp. DR5-3 TaxID=2992129 RepID=UPI00222FD0E1|nr:transposase [Micromonospora sp. DR5-3]MCW3820246.1 transposase [Micromonospora sp. DR5-3]